MQAVIEYDTKFLFSSNLHTARSLVGSRYEEHKELPLRIALVATEGEIIGRYRAVVFDSLVVLRPAKEDMDRTHRLLVESGLVGQDAKIIAVGGG